MRVLTGLFLFAALFFAGHNVFAQQIGRDNGDSEEKRVLDNLDIAPRSAVRKAEKPAEKPSQTNSATAINKDKKVSSKKAVIKTPSVEAPKAEPRKGEGYWQEDAAAPPEQPLPQPKIYSELQSNIDDSGKLVLTSDTIVVKPVVKTVVAPKAPIESTGDQYIDGIISKTARKHEIDPRLILEVIRQESGFRTRAVSHKGAQGLMQLIPSTASRFGVSRIYDPAENIEGGARYLRFLLDMFNGNLELALAGYNAGENAVVKYNYKIPPYSETRDYVRSITARYRSKFRQYSATKIETQIVRQAQPIVFNAQDGGVILSNNY